MAIVFQDDSLSRGITGASSALGQALQARGERKEKRNLEQAQRMRLQKSGDLLSEVIQQRGAPQSLKDLVAIQTDFVSKGGDISVLKEVMGQAQPFIKQQAQTQGAQDFLNMVLGGQGGASGVSQTDVDISSPAGNFYEQTDGVPDGISNEQIDALISSPFPQLQALGKQYDSRRQEARKNFVEDRNFHAKALAKTEEKIAKLRDTLPKRERVLAAARNAIESGDIGAFSRNRIADMIGGPIGDALRTKSGAQFALAAKENLVTNLGEISARGVNMFMEKRLLDAFAKVGQSEVANLAVMDFFEAENDIEKAYLKEYERLAEEDVKRFGFERKDLDKRARQAAKAEQQKIFNRSSMRQRSLLEREKGPQWMYKQTSKKVEKGTPLTPEMYRIFIEKVGSPEEALVRAKQLGYKIYSPKDFPQGKV